MPALDQRYLALLQAVGLCSCAASSGAPVTVAPSEPVHAPIEIEPERQPLRTIDALVRSGRESLAAGHFKAAHASLRLATQKFVEQQDAALIAESLEAAVATEKLALDMLDAALGAGDLASARGLIEEIHGTWGESRRLQSGVVQLRELENGFGLAPCDANVDSNARPLRRVGDAFAAWNELRSGLPADHAIPIPTDEQALLTSLCGLRCTSGEPKFVRLDGDNEATIALVVPHQDGSFSVLPDLLHTVDTGCGDQTALAFERHDGLVRVRAFGDRLDNVDPEDWHLVEQPEYAPSQIPASPSYAYASSGYPQGSSGSQPHGYAGSSYYQGYGYGCGDGDYDYGYNSSCQTHGHVERDVILDLDRGEVVLDIVRTGGRGSALGRVTMASAPGGPMVDVQACGVSRSLQLSYT
jgi:hypothetical protein